MFHHRVHTALVIAAVLGMTLADRAHAQASPEQKVLDRWVGTWLTSYKMAKAEWTPKEKQGTGDHETTRELGGRFVQEKSKHLDGSTGLALTTYDADQKTYRNWWFSSAGQAIEFTGKWNAETKTMIFTSTPGQPFTTTSKQRFVDDDTIEWDFVVSDGKTKSLFRMDGKSTRGKEEDKLLKEKISLINQTAAAFEKVTDRKSFDDLQPQMQLLSEKLQAVAKQWDDLQPERKEAAVQREKAQLDQAMERMLAAKRKAAQAAFEGK